MCGNDAQDRCRTGPAAMVQLGDSIIEDITIGTRAKLIEEGDAVDVSVQCPRPMRNAQDQMAVVYRLYASFTFQLWLRETVFPNNRQTCLSVNPRRQLLGRKNCDVVDARIVENRNEYLGMLLKSPRIKHEGKSDETDQHRNSQ